MQGLRKEANDTGGTRRARESSLRSKHYVSRLFDGGTHHLCFGSENEEKIVAGFSLSE